MRRLVLSLSCVALAVLAACQPDDEPLSPVVKLALHPEYSKASFGIDPTFPEAQVLVDVQVAVGLANADPSAGLADTVTLKSLELVSGAIRVPLAGGSLQSGAVDTRAEASLQYVYDADLTNAAASQLCGVAGVSLHVEVHGTRFGDASGDLPATLTCAQDRRAGELSTRPLGPNPPHRPCEIDQDDGSFTRLGWDANGRLEIQDGTFEGDTVRTVLERDADGQVTDVYQLSNGLLEGHLHYVYESGRPASDTNDDYRGDVASLPWSWSSDHELTAGNHVYTLSADGLTVTDVDGDTVKATTFGAPITLGTFLTQPAAENAASFLESAQSVTVAGQPAAELAVNYTDGDITSQVGTVGGVTSSTSTWKYACDFGG